MSEFRQILLLDGQSRTQGLAQNLTSTSPGLFLARFSFYCCPLVSRIASLFLRFSSCCYPPSLAQILRCFFRLRFSPSTVSLFTFISRLSFFPALYLPLCPCLSVYAALPLASLCCTLPPPDCLSSSVPPLFVYLHRTVRVSSCRLSRCSVVQCHLSARVPIPATLR